MPEPTTHRPYSGPVLAYFAPPAHLASVTAPHTRVIAAVIARDNRLLVCQRPPHKRHGGLWEFPGGKLEPGESDADAARRELREELGVEVLAVGGELFSRMDPGSHFLVAFLPVSIAGEPARHEHTALAWGTPEELAAFPLAPTDRGFVEHLLARGERGATVGR